MKYVDLKKLLTWMVQRYENSRGVVAATYFEILEHLQEMKNEMGQWDEYTSNDESTYICSHCKCIESKPTPYCPHCGLPMREAGA